MKNWLTIFLVGCVFSMYIFPFTFTFLPIGNTKVFLAVLGLILWIVNMVQRRESLVSKSMVKLSVWAMAVSLVSLMSLAYNDATDTAYVGYVVSMWVWIGAAYYVCYCIKTFHGELNVELVCKYFIGVCVVQCLAALFNEFIPSFASIVNRFVLQQDQEYLEDVDRMYGIGAAFDTAGTRFACALLMISFLLKNNDNRNKMSVYIYMICFVFLSIVGNMVARTTSAGMILGVCYILYQSKFFTFRVSKTYLALLRSLCIIVCILIPIILSLYSNPNVKPLFDFAFEGFISMFETGKWETGSTNELLTMWTYLPEGTKTWLIGDGYFISPHFTNPYYVGVHEWTFYMGTDVGYLRFIYYFGLIGLSVFGLFILSSAKECIIHYPSYKPLFIMILLMNYIIWAKVATDLFCVFALFLMLDSDTQEEKPNTILLE